MNRFNAGTPWDEEWREQDERHRDAQAEDAFEREREELYLEELLQEIEREKSDANK